MQLVWIVIDDTIFFTVSCMKPVYTECKVLNALPLVLEKNGSLLKLMEFLIEKIC